MTSAQPVGEDLPRPGDRRAAIELEQVHLDRIHDRVDMLRDRAERHLAAAQADRSGATFQARFERDVTAHHHASRRARFTFGDVESLAFGRLDLTDGDHLHVGRVSVVDEDGDILLVDWRAPAAAAFYQATAAHPDGVARRRTLVTRGRTLVDLDDELLDVAAADRLGLRAVTGQGALLASLERERGATMRDIVSTIQAEQDRIIRAPATGTLVVTGGPGTGKTVVALHRVASLLYRDRERFEGRGVLVIGPSAAFTEYTARVLPSLGEDRAVQRPLSGLAPRGASASGWDPPEVARVKGDLAMVELLRRALAAALPPVPPSTRISFDGTTITVGGGAIEALRRRHLDRLEDGFSFHDRTEAAEDALFALLFDRWARAHRTAGHRVPEDRHGSGFTATVADAAQVTLLRRCYWPEQDPATILGALAGGRIELDQLADDLLDAEDRQRLADAWAGAETWTVDDVALLDELATLLGTPPSKRPRSEQPGTQDDGIRLQVEDLQLDTPVVDVDAPDYRDFAHVVVDEAQDLTPMQWRMVARRGPYASWTVVGDLAQRSRIAEPADWGAIARLIGRRQVEVVELTMNYRTPAEIAAVATDVLAAAGHDPSTAPDAVRRTGVAPGHLTATDPLAAAARLVPTRLAEHGGTLAVLVAPVQLAEARARITIPAGEQDRVRVLEVREAKGLEFDDVVVVDPTAIIADHGVGTHQLYVAVTRATRGLTVVTRPGEGFPGDRHCVPVEG